MADIKFMDISENDNPATTDSILVANQENGVKRTTLGKIGDMFAVHGLLHSERVTANMKNGTAIYSINAPSVEGYTFAFWLSPKTTGKLLPTYLDDSTNPSTNINLYNPNNMDVETGDQYFPHPFVEAKAIYVKNTVA
jgi:hypothetical protein